jgi:hypothetical protein
MSASNAPMRLLAAALGDALVLFIQSPFDWGWKHSFERFKKPAAKTAVWMHSG